MRSFRRFVLATVLGLSLALGSFVPLGTNVLPDNGAEARSPHCQGNSPHRRHPATGDLQQFHPSCVNTR